MGLFFLLCESAKHLLTEVKTLAGSKGLPVTFQSSFLTACKSGVASEQFRRFTIHNKPIASISVLSVKGIFIHS